MMPYALSLQAAHIITVPKHYDTKQMSQFEKIIKRQGGRFNFEQWPEKMAMSYGIIKDRAISTISLIVEQLPEIDSIEFDIIDNYDFNAFATGSQGKYFIGLNRGTIASLQIIYDRLLVDHTFLPFIGNPIDEGIDLPLMNNITMNYARMVTGLPSFDRPKDSLRSFYQGHLTSRSLDFILAHEISHIVHGHVDYISSEYNLSIDELDFAKTNSVEFNMLSKVVELDADEGATKMLLGSELLKVLNKRPRPQKLEHLYESPEIIMHQFSICSSLIFRIFGDQRLDKKTFDAERYPKPRLRNAITLLGVGENDLFKQIQKIADFEMDSFGIPNAAKQGFETIEYMFDKITGKESNKESISDAWSSLGIDQINDLRNEWNTNYREQLSEFAYIDLENKTIIEALSNKR